MVTYEVERVFKMLNEIILELRKNTNLRQEDFAKQIGIARTTYAMYEQGHREPDYDTLIKIADFYGVSIDYLLGRTETPSFTKEILCIENDLQRVVERINANDNYTKMNIEDKKLLVTYIKTAQCLVERLK